jgi:hypothetical protein
MTPNGRIALTLSASALHEQAFYHRFVEKSHQLPPSRHTVWQGGGIISSRMNHSDDENIYVAMEFATLIALGFVYGPDW